MSVGGKRVGLTLQQMASHSRTGPAFASGRSPSQNELYRQSAAVSVKFIFIQTWSLYLIRFTATQKTFMLEMFEICLWSN